MTPAEENQPEKGNKSAAAGRVENPSMLTPTFMQAITNLRDATNSLKRATGLLSEGSASLPEKAENDSCDKKLGTSGELSRIRQRLLAVAAPAEPELLKPAPRSLKASADNRHVHFTVMVAAAAMVGLACLLRFAYLLFSPGRSDAIVWLALSIAALCVAAVLNPSLRCHCATYKWLVREGVAVSGQVSEKRLVTRAGRRRYFIDYAFNEQGTEQSFWGSMEVNEHQHNSVAEGDLLTVLYESSADGVESCIYRFCPFLAIIRH